MMQSGIQPKIELSIGELSDMDPKCSEGSEMLGSVVMRRTGSANLVQIKMEAASLSDVMTRDRSSSADLSNDDALEYEVSPNDEMQPSEELPPGPGEEEEEEEWRRRAEEPVLLVRCRKQVAELVKDRIGSGSRGRCIKTGAGDWFTPTEFEVHCGRSASKDWKRSIKFMGRPLQHLVDTGLLLVHAISCCCPCCIEDTLGAGPVRLQQPIKKRRKYTHQQTQRLIQLATVSDEGSLPHTISLPASVLSQIGLSLPNVDLSSNTFTLPLHQSLPNNVQATTSLLSSSNTIPKSSNTIVLSPGSVVSSTLGTNSFPIQTIPRSVSVPLVQQTGSSSTLSSLSSLQFPTSVSPNTLVLPVVLPGEGSTITVADPNSSIFCKDTIELTLEANEDDNYDDEDPMKEESMTLELAEQKPERSSQRTTTLQISSNSNADLMSIDEVTLDPEAEDENDDKSKTCTVGRDSNPLNASHVKMISNPRKISNPIHLSVINPRLQVSGGFPSSTGINVATTSAMRLPKPDQRKDAEGGDRPSTSTEIEKAFDKLDEVLSGIERGVSEARSLLAGVRGLHCEHKHQPLEASRIHAHLAALLAKREHQDTSPLLSGGVKEGPPLLLQSPTSPPSAIPPLTLIMGHASKRCGQCGRSCRLECGGGCGGGAAYCGPHCQRRDWPAHHPHCPHPDPDDPAPQDYLYIQL